MRYDFGPNLPILLLAIALALALSACAPSQAALQPTSRLKPPAAEAMVPPEPLPAPQAGQDKGVLLTQCLVSDANKSDKLVVLQKFVTRVTRNQSSRP